MKKHILFVAACLVSLMASAKTLYLVPGVWEVDDAKFAIWYWGNTTSGKWSAFMTKTDGVYSTTIDDNNENVIFIRFGSSVSAPNWDATIWNRTGDLAFGSYDTFTITGWGSDNSTGNWSKSDGDSGDIGYGTQAPANCPDIILQAFYYDSYETSGIGKNFGDTKWATLNKQASTLAKYFDMIWLPPSAFSTGGTGYIPRQYSNQNSDWGTETQLKTLIENLHAGGAKVMADIVVNHLGNYSNHCDFYTQDFGEYGKFTPDATWVTRNDEMNSESGVPSACLNKSTEWDDGYGDGQDFGGVRDLAHNKAEVREMCRAYLKWLKNEIGYDAWRWDFAKGFHGSHENDYNKASEAYFSVVEYWDGVDAIMNMVSDALYNTYAFDFPTKYKINTGIGDGNYTDLSCPGLICGNQNHAVTFVDNHDTFRREDGGSLKDNGEFMGNNGSIGNYENRTVQAYAFILSMPGVPCVFYPHYYSFKTQIKAFCDARHRACVHSGSACADEAGDGYYKATITGTNGGSIKLFIGPNSNYGSTPAGYTKAYVGDNCGVYYIQSKDYKESSSDDEDDTATVTVGFKAPASWTEVAAYAWNAKSNTLLGEWPGTKQTKDEDGWYRVTIKKGAQIIFNNGKKSGTEQTVDSDELTSDICYTYGAKAEGKYLLVEATGCIPTDLAEFYLIGHFNGVDVSDALPQYKFADDGTLTTSFEQDSYVYVKDASTETYYMAKNYITGTTGEFHKSVYGEKTYIEKMLAPAGKKLTYTLTDKGDDVFQLSYTVEDIPTGIEQISLTEQYEVYTVQGQRVNQTIDNLPQGIYLIRQAEATKKILIP